MAHGFLHWSANFDEVQDFEAQIRQLAGGAGLMADADYFAGTRSQPLGLTKAGRSADLDALAAYVASLDTFGDSPWRAADGSLTPEGAAGRGVFESANCAACHGGPNYTRSGVATLFDVGTIKPASGQRLGAPLTGIDPPTLRDAWATAPYLHDGSAATLADAVAAHAGVTLGATALTNLVAFLRQVDGREPAACPCDAFGAATPTIAVAAYTSAVELGVKFSADVAGFVTGIRFYKGGPANSGTHVGSLWSATGTLLGRATFVNETASGWQTVTFATPVAVTAGTTYVASYYAPNGGYSFDSGFFTTSGVSNGPLTLLSTTAGGGNGVYRYGATSGFPSSTWQGSNYWVDVIFTTN
jgi:hypothetical protein